MGSSCPSSTAPGRPTLVAAAVEQELAPFLERASRLPRGSWRTVVTGAGKINAALELDAAVGREVPESVVFLGSAGAFPSSGLEIGDVVIAGEEILADEGVEVPRGFVSMGDLGLPLGTRSGGKVYNEVPVAAPDESELEGLRTGARGAFRLAVGRLITVSTGTGTDRRAQTLAGRWRQPLAESMEGAAAALVAWRRGIPFVEIRGISNFTGNRDRASWELMTACEHAARVAVDWIVMRRRPE